MIMNMFGDSESTLNGRSEFHNSLGKHDSHTHVHAHLANGTASHHATLASCFSFLFLDLGRPSVAVPEQCLDLLDTCGS